MFVGVAVGVKVEVAVGDGVSVGTGVAVSVGVAVAVGVAVTTTTIRAGTAMDGALGCNESQYSIRASSRPSAVNETPLKSTRPPCRIWTYPCNTPRSTEAGSSHIRLLDDMIPGSSERITQSQTCCSEATASSGVGVATDVDVGVARASSSSAHPTSDKAIPTAASPTTSVLTVMCTNRRQHI